MQTETERKKTWKKDGSRQISDQVIWHTGQQKAGGPEEDLFGE